MNKSYKAAIEVADSLYAAGDLENARAEYINALRYKPNQPEAITKVNELNRQLGFAASPEKADSTGLNKVESGNVIKAETIGISDSGSFGAFGASVRGEKGLITLENDKIELKISPKGAGCTLPV